MTDSGPKIPLRIENLPEVLSKPLDNELGVLEALVVALAKGQQHAEFWQRLHDSALRDDRLPEMGAAYEKIAQDRRLRIMPAPSQAIVAMHAAEFYVECLGEMEGAIASLERALTLVPGHPEAFAKLVEICERRRDKPRLVQLNLTMASPKAEKEVQLKHLKKALSLAGDEEADKQLKIAQQILKLEPSDPAALMTAEKALTAASKFAEVARMFEQAVQASGSPEEALPLRSKLLGIYANSTNEVEKATPHVEEVLALNPTDEVAREVGQRLLSHKVMGPRAAAALEKVLEAEGDAEGAARMLAVQIEQLRGPKKAEAQKRLGQKFIALGDAASAYTNLEAVVLSDPMDDEARGTYMSLALELAKMQDAAKTLTRAAVGAKDAAARSRINADLGRVYIELGDEKKAKQLLTGVIDQVADDSAVLSACHAVLSLYEEGKDAKQIAAIVEKIATLDPDVDTQVKALGVLAAVSERDLRDPNAAIEALKRVMAIQPSLEAASELERLLEAASRFGELADIIESRANLLGAEPEARELFLRVATLRREAGEKALAVDALFQVLEKFGPERDVHELLLPLLEEAGRTPDLITILTSEATLAPAEEQIPILGRVALLRFESGDGAGALEVYGEILKRDPAEPAARRFVEDKLKTKNELRAQAAEILLPLYQEELATAGIVDVLEARADLAENTEGKLAALDEAWALANENALFERAVPLAQTVLGLSVEIDRPGLQDRVQRTLLLVDAAGAESVAGALAAALADKAVDDEAMAFLARATGKILVEMGDSKRALAAYQSVLAFEPSNSEVLGIVDSLLEEQGSPADRVKLYESALERHTDLAKRRELLHKIGAVQRRDLSDVRAAITTYRRALDEFPEDKAFRGALYASFEVAGAWEELYAEVAKSLEATFPTERAPIELRLADISVSAEQETRAAEHYHRAIDGGAELGPQRQEDLEKLSEKLQDWLLLRKVLFLKASSAETAESRAALQDRLGELESSRFPEEGRAAEHFTAAAKLYEEAGDSPTELAMHQKVLALEPKNRASLERVAQIASASGDDALLLKVTEALLAITDDVEERVTITLSMETPKNRLGDSTGFIQSLERLAKETGPRLDLLSAKARTLGLGDPEAATTIYRSMLVDLSGDDASAAAELFQKFLETLGDSPARHEDLRALYEFRANREEGDRKKTVLFSWAEAELKSMGSPERARKIVQDLLEAHPDDAEVLAFEGTLARSAGDFEAVAKNLERRAARASGEERSTTLIELAEVLIERLGREAAAVEVASDLLNEPGSRGAALQILERALRSSGASALASQMLEGIAESAETDGERASIYESLLGAPSGTAGASGEAEPLDEATLVRRRGLFHKLLSALGESKEQALDVSIRAVSEFPEEDEFWTQAEQLGRELERADRVSVAYQKVLSHAVENRGKEGTTTSALSPDAAMRIGERGVAFQEEWFDDPEAVTQMLKLIVDIAPSATWAFERLKLVYNSGERWEDLFRLYDHVLAGTEDTVQRIEILEDAVSIAKDLAADAERSMSYLEQLHAIEPEDNRTTSSLEKLYERHGKHQSLIKLLGERELRGNFAERTALRLRMAQLHFENLSELAEAADLLIRVLDDDSDDRDEAGARDSTAMLEKIVLATGADPQGLRRLRAEVEAPIGTRPETTEEENPHRQVRRRAALALRGRYAKGGANDRTARMIDIALESPPTPEERNQLLEDLIKVERDGLGDRGRAFETLAVLAALEPSREDLRTQLNEEATKLGVVARLVDVLSMIADRSPAAEQAVVILAQASTLAKDVLKDADRVISIDLRLLARASDDPVRAKAAATKLEAQLAKAGRDLERCTVLERLLELEDDKEARGKILHEIARLAETVLSDRERACRALRKRLIDEPDDLAALTSLVDNLRTLGQHAELGENLSKRIELLTTGDRQRRDLLELARLSANELQDHRAAIVAYERIIADHAASDEVANELAASLQAVGDDKKLTDLYEAEASRATSVGRSAELFTAKGEVHVRRGEIELAAAAFQGALQKVPGSGGAESGLEALLDKLRALPELHRSSVAALEKSYRAMDAWEKSLALISERLSSAVDAVDQAQIQMEAAALEESRSSDLAAAAASTWKAFVLAGEKPQIAAELLRRTRAAGHWEVIAAELLEVVAQKIVASHIERELLIEAADWLVKQDPESPRTEAMLVRALSRSPGDVEALSRLVEVRRRTPARPLVSALVDLANAYAGRSEDEEDDGSLGPAALGCLREAVTVALRSVGDPALSVQVATSLRDEAARRWNEVKAGQASAEEAQVCEDAVAFAIDVLVELHQEAGKPELASETLIGGAQLPFQTKQRRALLLRATDFSKPAEAIVLQRTLFDEDPRDGDVAQRLEKLYFSENRKTDVLSLRTIQIGVADTVEDRVSLRLSLASLQEELGSRGDAITSLRENLAEASTHQESVGFLARLLEADEKYEELAVLWESQGSQSEGETAIAHYDRAAKLFEERLKDLRRATSARKRIVDLAPTMEALSALATLLEKSGRHVDAAAALEQLVSTAGAHGEVDEALVLRLASAHEAAGHRERALAALERRDGPKASNDLRARLRAMYRALALYEPLANLLIREAEATEDLKMRLARLKEAAAIYTAELGRPGDAIPILETVLELDKTDLTTRLLLASAMRVSDKFEDAVQILSVLLEEYGTRRPKERALVHFELAKVYIAMTEPAKAMSELEAASKIDQSHPGILYALAKLAVTQGELVRAQRTFRALLLVVRSQRGTSRDHAFASTEAGSRPNEAFDAPVSRAEVFAELAALAEKQGESDRKTEFVESAFEAAKENSWELDQLAVSFASHGYHDLFVRVLDEKQKQAQNPRDQAKIAFQRATTLLNHLGKREDALESALVSVELDPTSKDAHALALSLSKEIGALEKYAKRLGGIVDKVAENPTLALDLALVEARTKARDLHDYAGARDAYARAKAQLDASLGEELPISRLDLAVEMEQVFEKLGDRRGQLDQLREILDLEASAGDSTERQAEINHRIAKLYFAEGEVEEAVDALERILNLTKNLDTVEERLREGLELAPKNLRMARLFEDFCRANARPDSLLDALVAVADRDTDERSPLTEAYELAVSLGREERAELLLLRILQASGDTEETVWALVALGERNLAAKKISEAADYFERAARTSHPDEERALLLRVAKLAQERLGDTARAIQIYQSLRSRDPADREVWEPLAKLLEKQSDLEPFFALYQETLPLVEDREERGRIRLLLAGKLLEKDDERAAQLLGETLDEIPDDDASAEMLAAICKRTGNTTKLIEIVNRRLDSAKDVGDKTRVVAQSMELGALLEQSGDDSLALETYQGALDWDAESREILRSVVRLQMKRDDSAGSGDELERLLAVEEGEAAVELSLRIADMKAAMNDTAGAERALLAGMKARPESKGIRDRLAKSYEARGANRELADLNHLEAKHVADPAERKARLLELATLYSETVGDAREAAICLGEAHQADPTDRDILFSVMDSWSNLGEHAEAIKAVDLAIESDPTGDPSWLFFSRAVLYEAMGQSDRALDDLDEAQRQSEGKYGAELRAHIDSMLVRAGTGSLSSQYGEKGLRLRLVELAIQLGDVEAARTNLDDILKRDGLDVAALRLLAQLEESRGAWDDAMTALRRLIALEDGEAVVETALRLARAANEAGRPADARGGLERALRTSPTDARVRTLLKTAYTAANEYAALATLLVDEARLLSDPEARHSRLVEAARHLINEEAHANHALEILAEATAIKPDDVDTDLLFADGLVANGRAGEARPVAERVIAILKGKRCREAARANQALARIETIEGNLPAALEAMSRAFENDPQNAALARDLGLLAVELDDVEVAQRAFRSITLMKATAQAEAPSATDRGKAYFHLGRIAVAQADKRRARLMLEKAMSEDPSLVEAKELLDRLD